MSGVSPAKMGQRHATRPRLTNRAEAAGGTGGGAAEAAAGSQLPTRCCAAAALPATHHGLCRHDLHAGGQPGLWEWLAQATSAFVPARWPPTSGGPAAPSCCIRCTMSSSALSIDDPPYSRLFVVVGRNTSVRAGSSGGHGWLAGV